ncbi:uncharacterized protein B0H64DRAFT_434780 [Chaetomium fimeti]|uniref:Uncharacterized protein n=1 Tax=Chaetomium fimeti TaxID=1854472 RepID=A0AAE0HBV0_9PEZI|nr:hypothetical protein B0H64DRAFT_434780 [Chaetomium fimeti]
MASQDSSTPLVNRGASWESFTDGYRIEPVSLNVRTVEEIVDYVVKARTDGTESIVSFHWQPSKVENLLTQLGDKSIGIEDFEIRRVEYDYKFETVYLDITNDTELLNKVQAGLRYFLQNRLNGLVADMADPAMHHLARRIKARGTFLMRYEDKICKQADLSFGLAGHLPSLVCEIFWSQPRQYIERKAHQYIEMSDGQIRAVLILDLQYPDAAEGCVGLLVADDSGSSDWIQRSQVFYDETFTEQPNGRVDLYISDFRGCAGLPAALCRPSAIELAAGVSRTPQIILTYKRLAAIFRTASGSDTANLQLGDVDEEERLYKVAKRREAPPFTNTKEFMVTEVERHMTEGRIDVENCVTEAIEDALCELGSKKEELVAAVMEQRKARKRAELDRYVAAEMERYTRECTGVEARIAEGFDEVLEEMRSEMEGRMP